MSDNIVTYGFADALRAKIRVIMNDVSDSLSTGGAKSFDEYQKMVGVIEGLALAERELLDLSQEVENAD